jgi:hypothetical protein
VHSSVLSPRSLYNNIAQRSEIFNLALYVRTYEYALASTTLLSTRRALVVDSVSETDAQQTEIIPQQQLNEDCLLRRGSTVGRVNAMTAPRLEAIARRYFALWLCMFVCLLFQSATDPLLSEVAKLKTSTILPTSSDTRARPLTPPDISAILTNSSSPKLDH